ncbi:NAD(P)/FAD-dependent oxidoreductase [Streptococcus suis]|uniref:NAD(P)/FAD-dependent oxidoreductase n=1 Tax=Streptococcus suis TaxID=1307 RepID=A0A426TIS6_STRSU|nr:NAD(P)/FAD-dependent oxidoreductase [Streptococcus suis]RRR55158.1 NAD(P)/FAD-dependent oxidoreductase [Streptococcus suis]
MNILIIGASFAGLTAAMECQKRYPQAIIYVIDKEESTGYFPNALNWKVKGEISSWEEARVGYFEGLEQSAVHFLLGWECISIEAVSKKIRLKKEESIRELSYDYLILAMGAQQVWGHQSVDLSEKILTSKSIGEAKKSFEKIEGAGRVTVIGAGQIGLESLEALSRSSIKIRLIESQEWPLAKYFDQEMVDFIWGEFDRIGLDYHFSETVNEVNLDEIGQVQLRSLQGTYHSDLVLLGTNFRPHTDLVEGLVDLHTDGSILVDEYLETSQAGIFAVGDLIRMPVTMFGQAYLPMINHAMLTGRLVAENLLVKQKSLKPVQRIVSTHVFGYNLTSVGLTEREANLWLDTDTIRIRHPFSQWDKHEIDFKMVVSRRDGRVLGGQLVSSSNHIEQMNVLALAISKHMTVEDLLQESWLCLPGRTALQSFIVEAANQFSWQKNNQE